MDKREQGSIGHRIGVISTLFKICTMTESFAKPLATPRNHQSDFPLMESHSVWINRCVVFGLTVIVTLEKAGEGIELDS